MKITDKPISLEAAKLLGKTFRWKWSVPMRFVPTDTGLRVRRWEHGHWCGLYRGLYASHEGDVECVSGWFAEEDPFIVEGLPDEDL